MPEDTISKVNSEQNARLARVEEKIDNLEKVLNKFLDNEFPHFKTKIDKRFNWIMGLVITGILIPILLYVIK